MRDSGGWLGGRGPRQFRLCLRCDKCRLESTRILRVPAARNAPANTRELLGSMVLRQEPFTCKRCSWEFARLTEAALLPAAEAA